MALRTKIRFLLCLRLFLSEIPCCTFGLIPPNRKRRSPSVSTILDKRSTWKTVLSAGLLRGHDTQQLLESMTVKELRQILKASTLNQRGVLSQLKRKQDFVEYLNENLPGDEWEAAMNGRATTASIEIESAQVMEDSQKTDDAKVIQSIRKGKRNGSRPISMPPQPGVLSSPAQTSPKGALFERIYELYPPVKDQECLAIGEHDVRQLYHPILRNPRMTDMDVVFVGTASCSPGMTRGVSCTALRVNGNTQRSLHGVPHGVREGADDSVAFAGGTWLFDCGECTQLQVQRAPSIRPSRITRIFLTHAHGDHSFGLPGMLCLMGQDRERGSSPPIEIYGPEGLRMWLRATIRYSVSRIVPNYRVHELKDIPMAPEWELNRKTGRYYYKGLNKKDSRQRRWGRQGLVGEDPENWISRVNLMNLDPSPSFGEVEGGQDIYPLYNHPKSSDGAPVWEVSNEEDVQVYAAPMSHGIPCVGYVVEEQSRPGRLRDDVVKPIVERNLKALKQSGFRIPMKAMAVIKNLPVGSAFTFPDGTVVTQEDAVEPPRKGRKVVICGDTASSRALEGLSMDADLVIHEATNAFLAGIDRDTDLRGVTRDAIIHGHSTPYIAGEFAKRVRAKKLLLNHFSARYKGDQSVDSLSIMTRIEGQARKASGLNETQVAAAWDFMVLPILSH